MIILKAMSDTEKKRKKAEAKALKKKLKYEQKLAKKNEQTQAAQTEKTARPLLFAEYVKGILYLIFSVSLIVAILTSGRIQALTTSEIVRICIATITGKIILVIIATALFIYGLKHLKVVK